MTTLKSIVSKEKEVNEVNEVNKTNQVNKELKKFYLYFFGSYLLLSPLVYFLLSGSHYIFFSLAFFFHMFMNTPGIEDYLNKKKFSLSRSLFYLTKKLNTKIAYSEVLVIFCISLGLGLLIKSYTFAICLIGSAVYLLLSKLRTQIQKRATV